MMRLRPISYRTTSTASTTNLRHGRYSLHAKAEVCQKVSSMDVQMEVMEVQTLAAERLTIGAIGGLTLVASTATGERFLCYEAQHSRKTCVVFTNNSRAGKRCRKCPGNTTYKEPERSPRSRQKSCNMLKSCARETYI